jgi:hypothetical protein
VHPRAILLVAAHELHSQSVLRGPELQMDMARVLSSRAWRAHAFAGKDGPVACSYRDQTGTRLRNNAVLRAAVVGQDVP